MTASELAPVAAGDAAEEKAADIAEPGLREAAASNHYLVVFPGNTERPTKAVHDGVHAGLKRDHGILPRRVEGVGEGRWILMDYLDVVVHIFTPETRGFYRLEQLWGELPAQALERA